MAITFIGSDSINLNLKNIHQNIARLELSPGSVSLLLVSKGQSSEAIEAAFTVGEKCFGENYLQEALEKQKRLSHLQIEWHFIGRVQSNKTRQIATHFDWVETVDSFKIAARLNEARSKASTPLFILIQINIDNDPNKSGIKIEELSDLVKKISELPNLELRGLMILPKEKVSIAEKLEGFIRAKQLFDNVKKEYPRFDTLSMGMSGDYEEAIQAGSTLIRIGTAVFGKRD